MSAGQDAVFGIVDGIPIVHSRSRQDTFWAALAPTASFESGIPTRDTGGDSRATGGTIPRSTVSICYYAVVDLDKYRPRELSLLVKEALGSLPVVVVTGLRQAGKTTFLQNDESLGSRRYLTLDDFATLEAARREPEALLEGDEPITIDEAQKCPELLPVVKRAVDKARSPGRFLLSGSANLALLKGVSESLAGRALYLTLRPFSLRERLSRIEAIPFLVRFLDKPQLPTAGDFQPIDDDMVLDGGLPPIALGEAVSRELWLLGYEQTYLERDVRDLAQVADLISFRQVLRLAALRGAQILNRSELARDANLPASTASRYLGLLEASFVLDRLEPYLRNRTTRLIKSPKAFITDSGLAAHLAGVTDLSPSSGEPLRGALFETYVFQNLSAILGAHLPRAQVAFWNVQGRYEVDFIVTTPRHAIAIEVKAASRFKTRDLRGLVSFKSKTAECRAGILAYNGSEAVTLGDDLYAIPLGLLLS